MIVQLSDRPFEADFLFLKFCFIGEKDEKNCADVGDSVVLQG